MLHHMIINHVICVSFAAMFNVELVAVSLQ